MKFKVLGICKSLSFSLSLSLSGKEVDAPLIDLVVVKGSIESRIEARLGWQPDVETHTIVQDVAQHPLRWPIIYSVEPLIKDTPNKGNLSIKDKSSRPDSYYTSTFKTPNKEHLSIKNKSSRPDSYYTSTF